LHSEGGEEFLCRTHAAQNLSRNHDLLAKAVIELALRGDTAVEFHRHTYFNGAVSRQTSGPE
jgi:hypothetical protein